VAPISTLSSNASAAVHAPESLDKKSPVGDDPVNISVALQIVLQGERVPYQVLG
jgi:hypothetical protein